MRWQGKMETSVCHAKEIGEEKDMSGMWMPWAKGSPIGLATDVEDSGISQGSAERPQERWMWGRVERRHRCSGKEEERAEGVIPLTREADTGVEVVREVARRMGEKEQRERGTKEHALIVTRWVTKLRSVGHPRREEERERREEQWKG